jgi:pimeloyl-ACP methyl ester carboxylesterase
VEATRAYPDAVADHGIDEIAAHYATYMATLRSRPIVVGHSFGGLLDGVTRATSCAVWAVP